MSVFLRNFDWHMKDEHGFAIEKLRAMVGFWACWTGPDAYPPCPYDRKRPWSWCVLNGNVLRQGACEYEEEALEQCVTAMEEILTAEQLEHFRWHGWHVPEKVRVQA